MDADISHAESAATIATLTAAATGQSEAVRSALDQVTLRCAPHSQQEAAAMAGALRSELSRVYEEALGSLSVTDHDLLHRLSACTDGISGIEAWLAG
ncbi:hypothetical protein [Azospirillum sp. TSO5]|uniref:hypothetical protein n=1 Tax=Azospirillum sp. TSO5 TaxID=716760 RepID=UPI000D61DB4C|nr:hypothetical protein [Azospirillum sp. TSO5]PWC98041.1 hypothetical protein TSO5_03295 [Azospirillum sp. TSO5]